MKKVLVVDDNQANCDLIVSILDEKAETIVANSGEEALAQYKKSVCGEQALDIILLDIAMPGMDGIELLSRIRKDEASRGIELGHGIPIIMVTAYKEPFLEAFNGGCDDYILKPIISDDVIKKIEEKIGAL